MTGPTAVQVVAPDSAPSAPSAPPGRSDGAPVSPEEFVRLLAQLLHGTGTAAPDPLGQKIGAVPVELESEPPRKPETPNAEPAAPHALVALAAELIPVAPPSPPSPPATQDPGLESARDAGAEAPKAPTPPAVGEIAPRLSRSVPPEPRDLPPTASEAPPAPKPVVSPSHSPAAPVPDVVSPPAREEPRSPSAGAHAMQTASAPHADVTLGIGTGEAEGFRSSPDGDRANDRGRGNPNAGSALGGVSGAPASTAQPAPDSTDASTRASSAAPPRAPVDQVAERVGLAHREGREEVSFRLEPPELGAVRIQAVLEGQRLTLHIRTEHEAARAALEQSMPQLKESLSQQGIVAGRVTIELGLDTSARGFAGQDFAGSPRPEPGDPPARSDAVSVRSRQWLEQDRQGVDVWV